MHTITFEFETKEEASILIDLISTTLLEWNAKDTEVFIYEDLEEDVQFTLETYQNILEEKGIFVSCKVEDNTERENLTEYESGERFY